MKDQIQFRTGCSGYYNRHWKGIFYPEKLPSKQWLNFYSGQLSTVEINATFYKFPTAAGLRTWFDKTPDDFVFSVKAPKIITHIKKMAGCEDLINDLYVACKEGLGDKLGCVLFQLPPGIQYSDEMLTLIISSLKPGFKNVVEFRHQSWWNEEVCKELARNDIFFCSVSHPQMPATIISGGPGIYLRLHGTPRMFYSDYSPAYLEELIDTMSEKAAGKEVYVYFNNTAGTAGILNAVYLQQLWQERFPV